MSAENPEKLEGAPIEDELLDEVSGGTYTDNHAIHGGGAVSPVDPITDNPYLGNNPPFGSGAVGAVPTATTNPYLDNDATHGGAISF